jgi:tetratricopeptide (TPR) repeat protein
MTVPAARMLSAYEAQYRRRPDARFLLAFRTLPERAARLFPESLAGGPFLCEESKDDGKEVRISLSRDGRTVAQAALPAWGPYPSAKEPLLSFARAMGIPPLAKGKTEGPGGTVPPSFDNAVKLMSVLDPRFVTEGMRQLDRCWREGYRSPRVLKAAARGYALLVLVGSDYGNEELDPLSAEAMALLALASAVDPSIDTSREEALLAHSMGYGGYANRLLADRRPAVEHPSDRAVDAFLLRDPKTLKELAKNDAGPLAGYLLVELSDSLCLSVESAEHSGALLRKFPWLPYPVLLQNIRHGDVGIARVASKLLPYLMVAEARKAAGEGTGLDPASIRGYLDNGAEDAAPATLSEYGRLLRSAGAKETGSDGRVLFPEGHRDRVWRASYADALMLRFHVLANRWGVDEHARKFAESLSEGSDPPLVSRMKGEMARRGGDTTKPGLLFVEGLRNPATPAHVAYLDFLGLADAGPRNEWIGRAAGRFDGRPLGRHRLAELFRTVDDNDRAASCLESYLEADPFSLPAYPLLAHLRGDDSALAEALKKFPSNVFLLRVAGERLSGSGRKELREAGEGALKLALALAPGETDVVYARARSLEAGGRLEEAATTYDDWLRTYSDNSLRTVAARASAAKVYLKLGKPAVALERLGNAWESYKFDAMAATASACEAAGELDNANRIVRKAAERYDTSKAAQVELAGYLWRQKRDADAADLLAKVRAYPSSKGSDWFADRFAADFANRSDEEVLKAVELMSFRGLTLYERYSLADALTDRKRGEVAARIASGIVFSDRGVPLDTYAYAFSAIRKAKGREAALAYMTNGSGLSGTWLRVGIPMELLQMGFEGEALDVMGDPSTIGVDGEKLEFVWLTRLICWLEGDRKPESLGKEFEAHYGAPSPDRYRTAGRYLLGKETADRIFETIDSPDRRCEFAYYFGVGERLKGNFREAALWYRLCQETNRTRNIEHGWAGKELRRWRTSGTERRRQRIRDDVPPEDKAL